MTIYVDRPIWPFRGKLYCHMASDETGCNDEIIAFGKKLGLRRSWLQNKTDLPHFDVSPTIRRMAIQAGAVEIDNHDMALLIRKHRAARLAREAQE